MTICLDKTLQSAVKYYKAGQYAEAIHNYHLALELAPDLPELHINIGSAFLACGQLPKALEHFQRTVHLQPDFAEAHYNLGIVQAGLKRLEKAMESYKQSISLKPDFLPAHFNLANVYSEMNLPELGMKHYLAVLRLNPRHVKALTRLGTLVHQLGRSDQAISLLQQATQIAPDFDLAYKELGLIYTDLCEFQKTLECFHALTQLRPDWADAHCNEGAALNQLGRYCEAIAKYEDALQLEPDHASAHWNRSLLFLLQGRYAEGWPEYRWRLRTDAIHMAYPHTYTQAQWDGTGFRGKRLLVHYEQGLGDVLQFLRYLPLVKARGGTVLFETPQPICALIQDWDCINELLVSSQERPVQAPFDLQISLMDLPGLFQSTLDDLPGKSPYIRAEPTRVKHWGTRFAEPGFKVGLVWAGGAVGRQRVASLKLRACQLQHLAPLATIPDVKLFGLQKGPGSAQVATLSPSFLVHNVGESFTDFADTAGAIENMDLIISVDTSVAHLAGAMGKPTWVLLKFDADWRWLLERSDSPWYPSMRLFRQARNETWPTVIERVAQALRAQVELWMDA
jgi:tetratricopeptide (TPR) repeat protein